MIYIVSMELISKSTHHSKNKKPHERGALDLCYVISLDKWDIPAEAYHQEQ